jgi:hypothetical protein
MHLNVCLTPLGSDQQQLLLSACKCISFQCIVFIFFVSLNTYPYYVDSISMKLKEDSKGEAVMKSICYSQKDSVIKYITHSQVIYLLFTVPSSIGLLLFMEF